MNKLNRVYPAGSRTDSSNYNPVPLWNAGCQIGTWPQTPLKTDPPSFSHFYWAKDHGLLLIYPWYSSSCLTFFLGLQWPWTSRHPLLRWTLTKGCSCPMERLATSLNQPSCGTKPQSSTPSRSQGDPGCSTKSSMSWWVTTSGSPNACLVKPVPSGPQVSVDFLTGKQSSTY